MGNKIVTNLPIIAPEGKMIDMDILAKESKIVFIDIPHHLNEDDMMAEAIKRYPKGTKYLGRYYKDGEFYNDRDISTVIGEWYWGNGSQVPACAAIRNGERIFSGLCHKGRWVEIVEEPLVFKEGEIWEAKANQNNTVPDIIFIVKRFDCQSVYTSLNVSDKRYVLNRGCFSINEYTFTKSTPEALQEALLKHGKKYDFIKKELFRCRRLGKYYHYINHSDNIETSYDNNCTIDNERFNLGNYFMTFEIAKDFQDSFKKFKTQFNKEH